MNPWLAALLGAWVGAIGGFLLAAIIGAGHVDRSGGVFDRDDDPPETRPRRPLRGNIGGSAGGAGPYRGGYPSQGPPITSLPQVPAGPAPGARRVDNSPEVCVAGMGPRCGCTGCVAERVGHTCGLNARNGCTHPIHGPA